MNRSQADLGITVAVAVLACAAAAVGAPVAVMIVLGIVLFAAPGYLLGQLLLGPNSIGLERVAVSTGLAFIVPIFGGLLLYVAGVPLHRAAWLGLLAGVTLVGEMILTLPRTLSSIMKFLPVISLMNFASTGISTFWKFMVIVVG